MSTEPPPRPSFSPIGIGTESRAPFALLPDPVALFEGRATRFRATAEGALAPYLSFLAAVAEAQGRCAGGIAMLDEEAVARSLAHGMPPIDRQGLKHDAGMDVTVRRFLDACGGVVMPEVAEAARAALLADNARRHARIADALEDAVAMEDVAGFVLAAAGVQVHLAGLAAGLPAAKLAPVGDGACPCCGGPPGASLVVARDGAQGARFAVCAACGTEWNVVRVKCTLCGATGGIAYHEIEGSTDGIQAETCDSCGLYVKIMAQERHPELDPVADDVASMALDLKLGETVFRRGGVNPFLAGM